MKTICLIWLLMPTFRLANGSAHDPTFAWGRLSTVGSSPQEQLGSTKCQCKKKVREYHLKEAKPETNDESRQLRSNTSRSASPIMSTFYRSSSKKLFENSPIVVFQSLLQSPAMEQSLYARASSKLSWVDYLKDELLYVQPYRNEYCWLIMALKFAEFTTDFLLKELQNIRHFQTKDILELARLGFTNEIVNFLYIEKVSDKCYYPPPKKLLAHAISKEIDDLISTIILKSATKELLMDINVEIFKVTFATTDTLLLCIILECLSKEDKILATDYVQSIVDDVSSEDLLRLYAKRFLYEYMEPSFK